MSRLLRVLLLVVCGLGVVSVLRASLPLVQTGKWAGAGALAESRSGAAAVLLPDGRVLVTGGDVNGAPSSSIEIFNADGSIRSGSPMAVAR
ncbi:MAG TPA: hypothetical protein VHN74_20055, partial [Candidatus Angelobacter sp.]|nr:hypothetical protein [Candidatus Angelobacter sp.]